MSRRRKGRDVHGIVLLDKPAGYSSSQAVQKVRWLFQARKAGHTGSLDPFATGMLPICLGEASKTAGCMLDASKTYLARALLGQATSTGDIEGETCATAAVPDLGADGVAAVLAGFEGTIRQVPPMYSALKHEGQPLYRLARAGREVERAAGLGAAPADVPGKLFQRHLRPHAGRGHRPEDGQLRTPRRPAAAGGRTVS